MQFARCRRGHELTPSNRGYQRTRIGTDSWYCRRCCNERRRLRRNGATAALPDTTTAALISARLKAAHERARAEGRPFWAAGKPPHRTGPSPARWCRAGLHLNVPENKLQRKSGVPTCRWCDKAAKRRYRERQQARHDQDTLRAAMIAAHPDKGGTAGAFIAARAAYTQALRTGFVTHA